MLDVMTTSQPGRRRRADAERSIASIVGAAVELISRRPDASMTEIAVAAGVGRVTLYAHFPSREALLEAAIDQAVANADHALKSADIEDGAAARALGRLIRTSWSSIDRYQGLLAAGSTSLSPARLRAHHAGVLGGIRRLIDRGQVAGEFRADLPGEWLVTVCYSLFHAAAEEVREGRLDPAVATEILERTLLGALAPNGAGTTTRPR